MDDPLRQQQLKAYGSDAARIQSALNEANEYLNRWEQARGDEMRASMIQSAVDALRAGCDNVRPLTESNDSRPVPSFLAPCCGRVFCICNREHGNDSRPVCPSCGCANEDQSRKALDCSGPFHYAQREHGLADCGSQHPRGIDCGACIDARRQERFET